MTRDRTARTRIRNYLVAHGPVDDPSGRATGVLKDLVSYDGSPVAFIQLIAAMDRDGEIVRKIRGKRTYRISATRAAERALGPVAAPGAPEALTVPVSQATVESDGVIRIDYDKLARALVRQLWDFTVTAAAEPAKAAEEPRTEPVAAPGAGDAEALRAERDRMIEERDEYAQRLRLARVKLDELLGVPQQEQQQEKQVSA
ncbi:hypothetical protein J8N05_21660 [Streptomyces sp. BH-SS-21]|uniref:Uncharacterized protein n=1 Tax=Streptomyces liliiviolaceus TaxID=2823109 RepID=A0A940XXL7_9ACTN|nr:hypothetical protein [Streptomyces liliiviolaceus]MBQ0850773.1 hypothetical protein [Streptomyces liliiviolaceus]